MIWEIMAKINEALLAILRCPVTGSPLAQHGEELISTVAGEDGVALHYRIDEGIALLLRPEQITA